MRYCSDLYTFEFRSPGDNIGATKLDGVMRAWCPGLMHVQLPGRRVAVGSSCRRVVLFVACVMLLAYVGGLTFSPVRVPFLVSCSSCCLCLPAHYRVSL